jgi:hypothetical protein
VGACEVLVGSGEFWLVLVMDSDEFWWGPLVGSCVFAKFW